MCQACAAKEEMHPVKTGNVDGGVKNHSSLLDCCINNLSSLQQTETNTHGGERMGKARNGFVLC